MAGACSLLLAAAAHPAAAAVEAGGLFNGVAPTAAGAPGGFGGSRGASCGSGGGGRRRGFAEYSTRGCFVLCVTPSSAKAAAAESKRRSSGRAAGGGGGGGRLVATSSVRRTRAGAVASQPILAGAFLNRGNLDQRGVANRGGDGCESLGLNRGGGGSGGDEVGSGGGARALECAMEDDRKGGHSRGRFRQVLNKMRGRAAAPPPVAVAAAGSQMMYDPGQHREEEAVDLESLRAGGNASTFNADAHCPTCRKQVPFTEAGVVSKLLFAWVGPLMARGNKKAIAEEDLWEMPQDEQMQSVADAFEAAYAKESAADAAVHQGSDGQGKGRGSAVVTGEGIWRKRHPLVPGLLDTALMRSLYLLYRKPFLTAGALRFMNTSVQFLPAILVQRLLRLLESGIAAGGAGAVKKAYTICAMLFAAVSLKTAIENQYFYATNNIGTSTRGVLSTAVYRKSLRLSPSARQNATVGEIVNYMQIDAGRLENLAGSVHTIWDSVFQLNTALFNELSTYRAEMSKQTDLRVKLVNEMLQGIRAIKFYNWETPFRERVEKIHDAELSIFRRAVTKRSLVVSVLSTTPAIVIAVTLGLYSMLGNALTPSKVFTSLTLFNQLRLPLFFFPATLNAFADAKVSVGRLSQFLNTEEVVPYVQRQNGVPAGAEGGVGGKIYPEDVCVSMKECVFYWTGEGDGEGQEQEVLLPGRTRRTVPPALHGCTLEVKKGELVAVVGAVGSGKSSLLAALLGDLKHVSGDIYAAGALAYVPQTAWIPNDTVRNNVLFGKPYDQKKYDKVLDVCRLRRDLELLENGDMTEIGEQGINLSGGQKQRLSLARALYSDAELFLLDDPLSALDAEVGKQVFERCVRDSLQGKTRILVTNQLQFLPQVDKIVVMGQLPGAEGSTIVDQGTYEELVGRGRDFSNILAEQKKKKKVSEEEAEAQQAIETVVQHDGQASPAHTDVSTDSTAAPAAVHAHAAQEHQPSPPATGRTAAQQSSEGVPPRAAAAGGWGGTSRESGVLMGEQSNEDLFSHVVLEEGDCGPVAALQSAQQAESVALGGNDTANTSKGGLMTSEERSTGAVDRQVYVEYMKALGPRVVLLSLVAVFVVSNFTVQIQQWVVSFWSSDPLYARHPLGFYLFGVTASAAVVGVFSHLRTMWAFYLGLGASKRLHGALLRRVLHAPVSFFDTTPVGRIIQRFSKDTDQVDQNLISQVAMVINGGLGVLAAGCAIIVATPVFAFILAPLSIVYIRVMNYFRHVAIELKRLESITKSPIYAHFTETLGGLSAIRAFGHVNLFARTNERLVDNNLASHFALKVVDRWLSVRLEMLGNFVVLMATLLSVFAASNGRLVAGLAGLSITNALSVTGLLNWAVRCVSETEMVMNSVERVLYTSQQTPQEPPHHVSRPRHPYYHQLSGLTGESLPVIPEESLLTNCPDDRQLLRSGWPWEGRIELRDDVTMRYRPDTDLVLKGVTLTIRPGEKIGIVGRTGSGKSSLMQVLFRMVDCEDGSIAIDGVDTKAIGLAALRSRLTIIPQEPVLFSGSLRANLDPFEVYTDEEVWDALEQASLAATVRRFPNSLLEHVAEYGESLSAGQRQLVCLARALLRKTRVLLLDEATSSVDYETDNVIQSTLRSAFRDCTVLTIAHRLNTIMDSDRILVMDDGKVAELDSPAALLEDPTSQFSQLLASERRQSSRPADEAETDATAAAVHDEEHDHRELDKIVGVVGGGEGSAAAAAATATATAAAAAEAPPPSQ
ncbi:ABC [Ectocarpus sp. CCAP 1310/34]|nr:ABC [Ectocarpus sp. CCAP 1310/34]